MGESKWISIERDETAATKTARFIVRAKSRTGYLGRIQFYPGWRKYAFYPGADTLYEEGCLRDIAQFCADETARWRARLS